MISNFSFDEFNYCINHLQAILELMLETFNKMTKDDTSLTFEEFKTISIKIQIVKNLLLITEEFKEYNLLIYTIITSPNVEVTFASELNNDEYENN